MEKMFGSSQFYILKKYKNRKKWWVSTRIAFLSQMPPARLAPLRLTAVRYCQCQMTTTGTCGWHISWYDVIMTWIRISHVRSHVHLVHCICVHYSIMYCTVLYIAAFLYDWWAVQVFFVEYLSFCPRQLAECVIVFQYFFFFLPLFTIFTCIVNDCLYQLVYVYDTAYLRCSIVHDTLDTVYSVVLHCTFYLRYTIQYSTVQYSIPVSYILLDSSRSLYVGQCIIYYILTVLTLRFCHKQSTVLAAADY